MDAFKSFLSPFSKVIVNTRIYEFTSIVVVIAEASRRLMRGAGCGDDASVTSQPAPAICESMPLPLPPVSSLLHVCRIVTNILYSLLLSVFRFIDHSYVIGIDVVHIYIMYCILNDWMY